MFKAELRFYKGKKPMSDQIIQMEDKVRKVVVANYLRRLPANMYSDLVALINMTIISPYVVKAKVKAIIDSINPDRLDS